MAKLSKQSVGSSAFESALVEFFAELLKLGNRAYGAVKVFT